MENKPLSLRNIPILDGLRTLAITLVLITHSWNIFKNVKLTLIDKLYFLLADFGVSGVDLFFVISGFLITRILLINKDKPKRYISFYVRRITRIWPPYLLFLSILFIVINSTHSVEYVKQVNFLYSNKWWLWFHLTNFLVLYKGVLPFNTTILWSLAIEEQFYLIWPFIVFSFKTKVIIKICLVYLAVSSLIRWFLEAHYAINLNVFTPTRLDGFVVGSLLGIVYFLGLEAWIRIKKIVLILFGISIVYMIFIMLNNTGFLYHGIYFITFGYLAISIFYGSVLYYCINISPLSYLHKIFTFRLTTSIAKYSYVIYLVHHPLSWLILNRTNANEYLNYLSSNFLAQVIYFLVLYFFSYIISFIVWHLYEKHFFKLRNFVK